MTIILNYKDRAISIALVVADIVAPVVILFVFVDMLNTMVWLFLSLVQAKVTFYEKFDIKCAV